MQSAKYEMQSDRLNTFCISYFALFTLHFRCAKNSSSLFYSLDSFRMLIHSRPTKFAARLAIDWRTQRAHSAVEKSSSDAAS